MAALSLELISTQLESPNLRDRMVALANLRHVSADDAVPLIKKVLDDQSLQLQLRRVC
jgi:HEAT repeat protein